MKLSKMKTLCFALFIANRLHKSVSFFYLNLISFNASDIALDEYLGKKRVVLRFFHCKLC